MEFNSWRLARAWNSVALAQSDDKNRPALFRTTLIEAYPEGVRLVATDSYILLKAWVPCHDYDAEDEPGRDVLPEFTTVCADRDRRVVDLMKYVQDKTKKNGADTPITMSLVVGSMRPGSQGELEGMVQQAVSFHLDHDYDERIETPIFDGAFPHWKDLWYAHVGKSTSMVTFGADGFLRLGKLSALWEKAAIRFVMGGAIGVAKFYIIAPDVNVEGLAMPVADSRVTVEDEAIAVVPASDEGFHAEYGDALDAFLAEVLKTEVPATDGDDLIDDAMRGQLIRAGEACINEGHGYPDLLVTELGISAERAYELLIDLADLGIIIPSSEDLERDPLYVQARALVVTSQQGAVSVLQRKLKVGLARAKKIMVELEEGGVVGPQEGVKPRPVLMTVEDLALMGEAKYNIGEGAAEILATLAADDDDGGTPPEPGEPEPV